MSNIPLRIAYLSYHVCYVRRSTAILAFGAGLCTIFDNLMQIRSKKHGACEHTYVLVQILVHISAYTWEEVVAALWTVVHTLVHIRAKQWGTVPSFTPLANHRLA